MKVRMTKSLGFLMGITCLISMGLTWAQISPDFPTIQVPNEINLCENLEIEWSNAGDPPYTLLIKNGSDIASAPIREFDGIQQEKYDWLVDINVEQITVQVEGTGSNSSIGQTPPLSLGNADDTSCVSNEAKTETVSSSPESTGESSDATETASASSANDEGDADEDDDDEGRSNKLMIGSTIVVITLFCCFFNTVM